MARKHISIISFNRNEAAAVEHLLNLLSISSVWHRNGQTRIERTVDPGGHTWILEHIGLNAQGNVVAATQLASRFRAGTEPPAYVVFYGCAGAVNGGDGGSVFLVDSVNYLSLGTVDPTDGTGERVTLKNKWLCHVDDSGTPPEDQPKPLETLRFPLCVPGKSHIDLPLLTGIPVARVLATDKVIRAAPTSPPTPSVLGPPHDIYAKAEWTYREALALFAATQAVAIVEMESYGIAALMQVLGIADRVAVLRVTTDSLADKNATDDDQGTLLVEGIAALARVVETLLGPFS